MSRRQLYVASRLAEEFITRFVKCECAVAGSIRRKEPTIGDVDLIVSEPLHDIEMRIKALGSVYVRKVNGGEKKMDVDYKDLRFNLFYAEPHYWGAMLFYLTGPAGYSIAYRRIAKSRGWVLNQYGLHDENGKVLAAKTEEDIYDAFGKEYKKPELRGT